MFLILTKSLALGLLRDHPLLVVMAKISLLIDETVSAHYQISALDVHFCEIDFAFILETICSFEILCYASLIFILSYEG